MNFSMSRLAPAIWLCAIGVAAMAQPELMPDQRVRLQSDWVEGGWREGVVVTTGKCVMIRLDKPTEAGYNRIALLALKRLQQRESGKWVDVDLAALLANEPTGCREEGAD